MSMSHRRWAWRMHLINFIWQQNLIIRWCFLMPSLALELDNLNCVTSVGFPFCREWKTVCDDGKKIFSIELCISSVGRVKNYKLMGLTEFCFLMIGISTRFSNTANMERTEAIWVSLLGLLLVCCVIFW